MAEHQQPINVFRDTALNTIRGLAIVPLCHITSVTLISIPLFLSAASIGCQIAESKQTKGSKRDSQYRLLLSPVKRHVYRSVVASARSNNIHQVCSKSKDLKTK